MKEVNLNQTIIEFQTAVCFTKLRFRVQGKLSTLVPDLDLESGNAEVQL